MTPVTPAPTYLSSARYWAARLVDLLERPLAYGPSCLVDRSGAALNALGEEAVVVAQRLAEELYDALSEAANTPGGSVDLERDCHTAREYAEECIYFAVAMQSADPRLPSKCDPDSGLGLILTHARAAVEHLEQIPNEEEGSRAA